MNILVFPKEDYSAVIPNGMSGIYFFYDENNKLLYIGKALNIRNRINQHNSYFSENHLHYKFKEFVKYIGVRYENNDKLEQLEKRLIKKYRPPLNVSYNEKHTERYSEKYKTEEEKRIERIRVARTKTSNNFSLGV